MDKIKILEIAAEAGLSNSELLEKAKELGFNVKAVNSTISVDDAGILVDYAISGKLPSGFKKETAKEKKVVVKKKSKAKEESSSQDTTPKTEPKVESKEKTDAKTKEEAQDTNKIEELTPPKEKKEPKKRKGISVVSKKSD
jgi:translation initiation factor IF-2